MALITQELFDKMSYDTSTNNLKAATTTIGAYSKPTALIVFAHSDINAALYYLTKSFSSPFDPQAIATVFVQESIKHDFIEMLQQQLNTYSCKEVKLNEHFIKALETCKKLYAHIITTKKKEENVYQPTVVCNFTHEQLGASIPSGIITLHTFRTAKEAITLVNKECLKFSNVSIWHENHSCAYELVAILKSTNFFINCHQVPLDVFKKNVDDDKNFVSMDKFYHYETMEHDGVQKYIIFPVGSIYAN